VSETPQEVVERALRAATGSLIWEPVVLTPALCEAIRAVLAEVAKHHARECEFGRDVSRMQTQRDEAEAERDALRAEVECAQNRRRAALCTVDGLAADHGVTLPEIDEEPYPCNRIALLVRAIASRVEKAEEERNELRASSEAAWREVALARAERNELRAEAIERKHAEQLVEAVVQSQRDTIVMLEESNAELRAEVERLRSRLSFHERK
jgi:hypothetical protein